MSKEKASAHIQIALNMLLCRGDYSLTKEGWKRIVDNLHSALKELEEE